MKERTRALLLIAILISVSASLTLKNLPKLGPGITVVIKLTHQTPQQHQPHTTGARGVQSPQKIQAVDLIFYVREPKPKTKANNQKAPKSQQKQPKH